MKDSKEVKDLEELLEEVETTEMDPFEFVEEVERSIAEIGERALYGNDQYGEMCQELSGRIMVRFGTKEFYDELNRRYPNTTGLTRLSNEYLARQVRRKAEKVIITTELRNYSNAVYDCARDMKDTVCCFRTPDDELLIQVGDDDCFREMFIQAMAIIAADHGICYMRSETEKKVYIFKGRNYSVSSLPQEMIDRIIAKNKGNNEGITGCVFEMEESESPVMRA